MNSKILATSRMFTGSPRKIFAAFENPEVLAKWWGPKDFTNTFETFEFKTGGKWAFKMHAPNGASYHNENIFREIQPDSKIVIEHVLEPVFTLTITLEQVEGKTLLNWAQEFQTVEMAEKLKVICEPANEQNLDRLEAVL